MPSHVRHPRLDRLPASGSLNLPTPAQAGLLFWSVLCAAARNQQSTGKLATSGSPTTTRPVDPPMLGALEALLFDEPGRCGGLDCHSHHFRLVRGPGGSLGLMVRHGGGDEFFQLSTTKTFEQTVASLDSNARYWLLHTVYRAYKAGDQTGRNDTAARWRLAAAEKRIKARKERGGDSVKVWIEPRADVSSDEQHPT